MRKRPVPLEEIDAHVPGEEDVRIFMNNYVVRSTASLGGRAIVFASRRFRLAGPVGRNVGLPGTCVMPRILEAERRADEAARPRALVSHA